jgi:FkbM family methyltransferase
MLKQKAIQLLHQLLGYQNYLFYFARFKIYMLQKDKYEKGFFKFMDLIPADGAILDIGANIGITTVPLAKKFSAQKIHSFEPIPANVQALKKVIGHYKLNNVQLHDVALGDSEGELKLVTPIINNVKKQGLCHVFVEGDDTEWNKGEICTIPVKTLDAVAELQKESKIAAIKIDVENFEYYVLKGARQLLSKHKPIIYCELWDNHMRQPVMDYLKDIGYAVKIVADDQLVNFAGQEETNFIFMPVS